MGSNPSTWDDDWKKGGPIPGPVSQQDLKNIYIGNRAKIVMDDLKKSTDATKASVQRAKDLTSGDSGSPSGDPGLSNFYNAIDKR